MFNCRRCGYSWLPRKTNPKYCPLCSSICWRTHKKKPLGHLLVLRRWRKRNRKRYLELQRKSSAIFRKKHPDRVKKALADYKSKNYDKIIRHSREYWKIYYKNNRQKVLIKNKQYRVKNKILYKIRNNIYTAIKRELGFKQSSTVVLLGCSVQVFKDYIARQFKRGMSWHNHGKWHLDHIKPCVSFDLTKLSEQRKCFHYSNYQPLWAKDNLIKNKRSA